MADEQEPAAAPAETTPRDKCVQAYRLLGLAVGDVDALSAEEQAEVAAMLDAAPGGPRLDRAFDAWTAERNRKADEGKATLDQPRKLGVASQRLEEKRRLKNAARGLLLLVALLLGGVAQAADLTITAASVKVTDDAAKFTRVQFGEAVTQGQCVYYDTTTRKYFKSDADSATAIADDAGAIVLTPSSTDGYGLIVTEGNIVMGATLTVGEIYVVSSTAGGVCPEADLSTAERVTILGVATSASNLKLKPFVTDAVIP